MDGSYLRWSDRQLAQFLLDHQPLALFQTIEEEEAGLPPTMPGSRAEKLELVERYLFLTNVAKRMTARERWVARTNRPKQGYGWWIRKYRT